MPSEPGRETIALFEEQVTIGKTKSVTERVRVSTTVEERPVLVEDELARESLAIEHVAVEREVAQAPEPRQDGDTLIVSIVEERLIVEKRLFVIEELHITRTSMIEHVAIPEIVRTMRATIEHTEPTRSTGTQTDG